MYVCVYVCMYVFKYNNLLLPDAASEKFPERNISPTQSAAMRAPFMAR